MLHQKTNPMLELNCGIMLADQAWCTHQEQSREINTHRMINGRGKLRHLKKNLSSCQFIFHRSHKDCCATGTLWCAVTNCLKPYYSCFHWRLWQMICIKRTEVSTIYILNMTNYLLYRTTPDEVSHSNKWKWKTNLIFRNKIDLKEHSF